MEKDDSQSSSVPPSRDKSNTDPGNRKTEGYNKTGIIVGSIFWILIFGGILGMVLLFCIKQKKNAENKTASPESLKETQCENNELEGLKEVRNLPDDAAISSGHEPNVGLMS